MIRFGQDVCGNLEAALRREWVETNGLGGFASSTINGLNTRRYHGLLVAATMPPVGRFVLLSKFEETLSFDGRRFDLSANRYPGVNVIPYFKCLSATLQQTVVRSSAIKGTSPPRWIRQLPKNLPASRHSPRAWILAERS
jgi:hypothetical protein